MPQLECFLCRCSSAVSSFQEELLLWFFACTFQLESREVNLSSPFPLILPSPVLDQFPLSQFLALPLSEPVEHDGECEFDAVALAAAVAFGVM